MTERPSNATPATVDHSRLDADIAPGEAKPPTARDVASFGVTAVLATSHLAGRKIKEILSGEKPAGSHER